MRSIGRLPGWMLDVKEGFVQVEVRENPVASAAAEAFRTTAEGASDLPLSAHGLILVAFFVGLVLWLVGGRFIKPAIATVGMVVGGAAGFLLLPVLGVSTVLGLPGPFLGMAAGGVLGVVLAVLMFRVSMVVAGAVTFGIAGFLGGAIYLQYMPSEFQPADDESPAMVQPEGPGEGTSVAPNSLTGDEMLEEAGKRLEEAKKTAEEAWEQVGEDTKVLARTLADRARQFADGLGRQIAALWGEMSFRDKQIMGLATLGGLTAGMLIGLLMPSKSAAMMTSMAGAAIWLSSATWLAHAFEVPGRTLLHRSPLGWAFIWIVFSVLGLMFQFTRAKRKRVSGGDGDEE